MTATGGPGWLVGVLRAGLTFSYLFGPFLARRLDARWDRHTVNGIPPPGPQLP